MAAPWRTSLVATLGLALLTYGANCSSSHEKTRCELEPPTRSSDIELRCYREDYRGNREEEEGEDYSWLDVFLPSPVEDTLPLQCGLRPLHGQDDPDDPGRDLDDPGRDLDDSGRDPSGPEFDPAKRIIAGKDALKGELPWQVMMRTPDLVRNHFCGATVISKHWILTAAHCFLSPKMPIKLRAWPGFLPNVRLSVGDHSTEETEFHEQEYMVKRLVIHKDYKGANKKYFASDVALIQVFGEIEFTDHVQPACLPDGLSRLDDGGEPCITSGWGRTEATKSPTVLKHTYVNTLSYENCMRYLHRTRYTKKEKDGMLCAYAEGTDSCAGDSGGPLVCKHKGRWVLQGVVSWGVSCAKENHPGIYAKVTHFMPWIQSYLNE